MHSTHKEQEHDDADKLMSHTHELRLLIPQRLRNVAVRVAFTFVSCYDIGQQYETGYMKCVSCVLTRGYHGIDGLCAYGNRVALRVINSFIIAFHFAINL